MKVRMSREFFTGIGDVGKRLPDGWGEFGDVDADGGLALHCFSMSS